jgi:hypothetical protein
MASMPPASPMQADPNAAPMPEAGPDADAQGYAIEIRVTPDGMLTVNGKPAKDIGEALKAALMIYQNNGTNVDEEAAFNSGMSDSAAPTPKDMNY